MCALATLMRTNTTEVAEMVFRSPACRRALGRAGTRDRSGFRNTSTATVRDVFSHGLQSLEVHTTLYVPVWPLHRRSNSTLCLVWTENYKGSNANKAQIRCDIARETCSAAPVWGAPKQSEIQFSKHELTLFIQEAPYVYDMTRWVAIHPTLLKRY